MKHAVKDECAVQQSELDQTVQPSKTRPNEWEYATKTKINHARTELIKYANEHNMYKKCHKTKETNTTKLTPGTKLKHTKQTKFWRLHTN